MIKQTIVFSVIFVITVLFTMGIFHVLRQDALLSSTLINLMIGGIWGGTSAKITYALLQK